MNDFISKAVEEEYLIYISDQNEKHWIGISADGGIEHSDNVNMDKMARIFWESIENQYHLLSKQIRKTILEDKDG